MKSVLVVVDFQNDFISGKLGFEKAALLRIPIKKRIEKALDEGEDLIFTMDTHYEDTYFSKTEGKNLPVLHCVKDSWGWQLDDSVANFKNKGLVFEKQTFGSMELAEYLRKQNYQKIELCGLVCSICVASNAVLAKAACSEAQVIVDSSLTEDVEESVKERTFNSLKALHINIVGGKK